MKSPTPEAQCAEIVFQIQTPICDVYFLNNISIPPGRGQQEGNWTWLNLWNCLTINLKNKSFNNSKDWLGFIFKYVSHHGRGKFSDLHCLNYWKTHFWNFSALLTWSDH